MSLQSVVPKGQLQFSGTHLFLSSPSSSVSVKGKRRIGAGPEVKPCHEWLCWLLIWKACTNCRKVFPGVYDVFSGSITSQMLL